METALTIIGALLVSALILYFSLKKKRAGGNCCDSETEEKCETSGLCGGDCKNCPFSQGGKFGSLRKK